MVSRKPPTSNPTELSAQWDSSPRWKGVRRDYRPEDVLRLRGSVMVEQTLAERGAERLWWLLGDREVVAALGALSGGQAVQMVRAGLEAIYLSGWQVAADANLAEKVYPDQSLYPATSAPALVRRLNNALRRADQVESVEGGASRDWLVPIVADAEAGFGGPLNAFELTMSMIEAGAAGVHFEDQLAAEKKCGHLGGKVLVPTGQFLRMLTAARLAADVAGVPTVLIARTDALSATLLTTDVDERDRPFLTGDRTAEGYWRIRPGLEAAIARGLASAPYADLLWFETSTPDLDEAASFAAAVHAEYPGKLLAVLQLAQAPGRADHRPLPEGARPARLPVPVHHSGRLPRAERRHVRAGQRLRRAGHARLRGAAAARAGAGGRGLHRDQAPARGRHRLLRRRLRGDLGRHRRDAGDGGEH